MPMSSRFQVFSTCPQSSKVEQRLYLERVADVSRWSERHGYTGMLVYYDHSLVDPWIVAVEVLRATERLCPLIAVQPATMHPHSVAKLIASMAHLYERPLFLNMIAGGFVGDLTSIGDHTPHDRRYDRLREFTDIVMALTAGDTLTTAGDWYETNDLKLAPSVPEALRPRLLMSGSSPASLATATALGATAIQYPQPPGQAADRPDGTDTGIRVGIVAREDSEQAWRVAHDRFPPNRRGELMHQMAMTRSDSQWHRTLSELATSSAEEANPYWLGPFESYDTFCPYLVGSYNQVAEEVAEYWADGHRTVILDIPPSEDELAHTRQVFDRAEALVVAGVTRKDAP